MQRRSKKKKHFLFFDTYLLCHNGKNCKKLFKNQCFTYDLDVFVNVFYFFNGTTAKMILTKR